MQETGNIISLLKEEYFWVTEIILKARFMASQWDFLIFQIFSCPLFLLEVHTNTGPAKLKEGISATLHVKFCKTHEGKEWEK